MVEKLKLGKNLIAIAIIIVGVLIAGAIFYVKQGKSGILTSQQVAEKTINFINQYLVEPGMIVSLLNVTEERGLYKISFKTGEEQYDSYVTKDGKLLFFQGINMDMEREISESQPQEESLQSAKEEQKFSEEQLETLAKCLTDKGAKFYGTYWCRWCTKQKEMFGKSAQYLPYIECADEETQQTTSQCQEAGIQSFPTWEFFGEKKPGFKTAEELAQLAGCSL